MFADNLTERWRSSKGELNSAMVVVPLAESGPVQAPNEWTHSDRIRGKAGDVQVSLLLTLSKGRVLTADVVCTSRVAPLRF